MKLRFCTLALLLILAASPIAAQDHIPETSGFSGFAMLGGTYFGVASNFLVGGKPIVLNEVGDALIPSIFAGPSTNTSPGLAGGGEVNYTFSSSRTQIFLGNRLEDLLRLDLVFGLGVRQQIGKAGILAGSVLYTPAELEFWVDPYIQGEVRQATEMTLPGYRLRWSEVFGTGLELTLTDRFYEFDQEASGAWLASQGQLDPSLLPLLDRNGDILRFQALYRIDAGRHRFEPALRLVDDRHDGKAMANDGYSVQLTYLWRSPKVILDVNVLYGSRTGKAVNPIYLRRLDSDRWGAALTAFIPVRKYERSVLSVFVGGEYFRENTNIDFYDSAVNMVTAGVIWRHIRK